MQSISSIDSPAALRVGISSWSYPWACGALMDALATLIAVRANHKRVTAIILEQWPPYQGTLKRTMAMEKEWVERGFPHLKEIVKTVVAGL